MALQRRDYLKFLGATAGVGAMSALAGCSSSCPDTDLPDPDQTLSIGATPIGPLESNPGGSWPTIHGNPGNTGFSPSHLPDSNLDVRWRTDLELPNTDSASLSTSAPVIGSEHAIIADQERVFALSLQAGEEIWHSDPLSVTFYDTIYQYEANTVSPAIDPDGTVYVGTESGVIALDGEDGSELWRVDGLTAVSSPKIVDGTIYAVGRNAVVALDNSGEERWRRSIERGEEPVPPAVGETRIVIPVSNGVRAFDRNSGEPLWNRSLQVETWAVVENGTCFVGNYEGLFALDMDDGTQQWRFDRGNGRSLLSPVLTPETIYAVEQPGEAGAASFALERSTAEPEPRWCSYIGSGAVVAATDDLALAILSLGEGPDAAPSIVGFSESLGEARWAIKGESHPRGWILPPAIVDGTIVSTTRGGRVVAVDGGG